MILKTVFHSNLQKIWIIGNKSNTSIIQNIHQFSWETAYVLSSFIKNIFLQTKPTCTLNLLPSLLTRNLRVRPTWKQRGWRRWMLVSVENTEMVEKTDMCADNASEHTVMEVSNNAIRFRCFSFSGVVFLHTSWYLSSRKDVCRFD